MQGKVVKIIMGVIAIGLAVAFFAVPVLKVKDVAMTIVVAIGVVAMVWNFVETVREKD